MEKQHGKVKTTASLYRHIKDKETIWGSNFEWLSFDEQFNCGLEVLFTGFRALK
ncbi:MAG: hypothetical protein LBG08_00810 [Spirochaetaceae bacterium]|jgi:hypothetical protein|nr:hypothetical protein [Spirochaetaceae bacterium]